ncbi:MAG: WGR domain-containing protein [Methylococcales bacterium]|nr:WGR domain-containing protein [Methylococcales bacterium]
MRYASRLINRQKDNKTDRFYHLFITEDLFGDVMLIKEYGKVGSAGIVLKNSFISVGDASVAMKCAEKRMLRKGYHLIA